jgi:hypothetical protein
MKLDNTKIRGWKYLIDVFIKQYKFNMDMALDRSGLLALRKEAMNQCRNMLNGGERRLLKLIHPYLKKKVNLFSNTFKDPYFDHLIGAPA